MSRRSKRKRLDRADAAQTSEPDMGQEQSPSGAETQSSAGGWQVGIICILLVVAVWIVFGQTLNHESVNFDDDLLVFEHPVLTNGVSLKGIEWVFTHSDDGH